MTKLSLSSIEVAAHMRADNWHAFGYSSPEAAMSAVYREYGLSAVERQQRAAEVAQPVGDTALNGAELQIG